MKPIIFNTEMVRAILGGRKTQTRRVIKIDDAPENWKISIAGTSIVRTEPYDVKLPRYAAGDILWVRETWCKNGETYLYKAGCPHLQDNMWIKWRPSIFMPKEACRIKLRVTNVRVERLQDITEEDAIAEGINWLDEACYSNNGWTPTFYDPDSGGSPVFRDGFTALWDSINAKRGYGWDTNPWVWVIEFERVEKP